MYIGLAIIFLTPFLLIVLIPVLVSKLTEVEKYTHNFSNRKKHFVKVSILFTLMLLSIAISKFFMIPAFALGIVFWLQIFGRKVVKNFKLLVRR